MDFVVPTTWLMGFGLVLIRTSALVLTAPILGFGTSFGGYKIAIILCISAVLFFAVGGPLEAEVDSITLGAMALREALIGVFLGFFLQLVLVAVRVAGELIGHEMGFTIASQVDPASGIRSSLLTSFYENVFLLAFLMLNGHQLLIRSLDESFERAPIGKLEIGSGMAEVFQSMFQEMFSAGLVFAAPVMVFLVLVSILIGLLSRAVPTLNVLEVGFSVRIMVAIAAMFVFAPLLEPAMTGLHAKLVAWMDVGLEAIEG